MNGLRVPREYTSGASRRKAKGCKKSSCRYKKSVRSYGSLEILYGFPLFFYAAFMHLREVDVHLEWCFCTFRPWHLKKTDSAILKRSFAL